MTAGRFLFPLLFCLLFLLPGWIETTSGQEHQPDLQWRTLVTPHFSVHFPRGYEKLAREIARICEEVYDPVSKSLNYRPHRTQVVVHTRSDVTNGFVTPLPWRMELFITESQDNLIGSKDTWLRVLITHEFTHVVQGRKKQGISLLSYPFFGELNSFWHNATPNWYAEGFATYNETALTTGGRGRNPFQKMKLLAPLLNDNPWRLANSNFPSRKRLPQDINYVTGYYLAEYVSEKYGEAAWGRIMDRYFANPIAGFQQAFKKVTGHKPASLYKKMLAETGDSLRRRAKSTLPYRVLRWPAAPENQLSPRWLDNRQLVFHRRSYDDLPEIARMDTTGRITSIKRRALFGNEQSLDARNDVVVWSELQQHLRFSATTYADLFLYNLRSRSMHRLTRNGRVYSPSLSPDSHFVAAIQTDSTGNRLVKVSGETGAIEPLLDIPGAVILNPAWSPDGRRIAFAVKDSMGRQDIAVLDLPSNQWRLLGESDRSHDNSPCWTPDGRYVLFTSDRSGTFNIWAVDVRTHQRVQLTDVPTGAFAPAVSPDGTTLAFTLYTEHGFLIATQPLIQSTLAPSAGPAGSRIDTRGRNGNPVRRQRMRQAGETNGWRTAGYNPLGQILRPQGWFPTAREDENGLALGLFMISADALHQHDWSGYLALSTQNLKPLWDIEYTFKKYWPQFTVRSFGDVDLLPSQIVQDRLFERWLRNRGLEVTAGVPLTLETNVNTTFVRPFIGYKGENIDLGFRNAEARIDTLVHLGDYRGLRAGLQFFRASQTLRDVVPHSAIVFSVLADWSSSYLKSDFKAQQYTGVLNTYLPTWLRHHQVQVQLSYTTRGGNFGFDAFRSYPLGYNDSGRRKLLRAKLAYHFPLAYVEQQMPALPVYLDYLAATLFYDWGTDWNHGTGRGVWRQHARASSGVVLSGNTILFQTLAVRIGIAAYYRDAARDFRVEPVIGINF